ncbi:MAG: hypothetical protein AAB922_02685 [Patescibacteria group bacterium]
MRIKRILSQMRRDFIAIYEREHCGAIEERTGYDDSYFHQEVIPKMVCQACGKNAGDDYRPLTTKYPEGMQI